MSLSSDVVQEDVRSSVSDTPPPLDAELTRKEIRRSVRNGRIKGGILKTLICGLIITPIIWYFFGTKIYHQFTAKEGYTRLVTIDKKFFKVQAAKGKFAYDVDIRDFWKINTGVKPLDSVVNAFSRVAHTQNYSLQGSAGMAMEVKLPEKNKVPARIDPKLKRVTLTLPDPYASRNNITWDVAKAGGYRVKNIHRAIGDHVYNLFGNEEIDLTKGFQQAEDQIMTEALAPSVYPKLLAAAKNVIQQRLVNGFLEPLVNLIDPGKGWQIIINWKKPSAKSLLGGT